MSVLQGGVGKGRHTKCKNKIKILQHGWVNRGVILSNMMYQRGNRAAVYLKQRAF